MIEIFRMLNITRKNFKPHIDKLLSLGLISIRQNENGFPELTSIKIINILQDNKEETKRHLSDYEGLLNFLINASVYIEHIEKNPRLDLRETEVTKKVLEKLTKKAIER